MQVKYQPIIFIFWLKQSKSDYFVIMFDFKICPFEFGFIEKEMFGACIDADIPSETYL